MEATVSSQPVAAAPPGRQLAPVVPPSQARVVTDQSRHVPPQRSGHAMEQDDAAAMSAAGWQRFLRPDGAPYYFHAATKTTSWEWRTASLKPTRASALRQPPSGRGWGKLKKKLPKARKPKVSDIVQLATQAVTPGQADIAWSEADWDIVLVLPLPEARARAVEDAKAQAAASAEGSGCCGRQRARAAAGRADV